MLKELKDVNLEKNERLLLENGWGKETADNVRTLEFFYKSDNEIVKGYTSFPKKISGKLPVIIWNRGGNNKSGLLDDFLASGILGEIASWGYIVFASQYREKDEFGGKDVNDVLNLIEEAKKFELSDEKLIGMEGWSRGGMMSYLTLTKTDVVKCCVIVAGLADLIGNENNNIKLARIYFNSFGTRDNVEFLKRKKDRSAVYWFEKICPDTNILFIHGTADDKISKQDSVEMYNKLSKRNLSAKYDLQLINGGDHYLRKYRKNVSLLRKMWFDSYLKF